MGIRLIFLLSLFSTIAIGQEDQISKISGLKLGHAVHPISEEQIVQIATDGESNYRFTAIDLMEQDISWQFDFVLKGSGRFQPPVWSKKSQNFYVVSSGYSVEEGKIIVFDKATGEILKELKFERGELNNGARYVLNGSLYIINTARSKINRKKYAIEVQRVNVETGTLTEKVNDQIELNGDSDDWLQILGENKGSVYFAQGRYSEDNKTYKQSVFSVNDEMDVEQVYTKELGSLIGTSGEYDLFLRKDGTILSANFVTEVGLMKAIRKEYKYNLELEARSANGDILNTIEIDIKALGREISGGKEVFEYGGCQIEETANTLFLKVKFGMSGVVLYQFDDDLSIINRYFFVEDFQQYNDFGANEVRAFDKEPIFEF